MASYRNMILSKSIEKQASATIDQIDTRCEIAMSISQWVATAGIRSRAIRVVVWMLFLVDIACPGRRKNMEGMRLRTLRSHFASTCELYCSSSIHVKWTCLSLEDLNSLLSLTTG